MYTHRTRFVEQINLEKERVFLMHFHGIFLYVNILRWNFI